MMTYREIYETNPVYWKSVANVKATYLRALFKLRQCDAIYKLRDLAWAMRSVKP
jgi:hypothetical protein